MTTEVKAAVERVAHLAQWDDGNALVPRADIRTILQALSQATEENERLNERLTTSVTVGSGLSVYGSWDAVKRVQTFILLDSEHPVEKEDVRRSLMRQLLAAEAEKDEAKRLAAKWANDGEHAVLANDFNLGRQEALRECSAELAALLSRSAQGGEHG